MKLARSLPALLILAGCSGTAPAPVDLSGTWYGRVDMDAIAWTLSVGFDRAPTGWKAIAVVQRWDRPRIEFWTLTTEVDVNGDTVTVRMFAGDVEAALFVGIYSFGMIDGAVTGELFTSEIVLERL